jgi:hypothetical protein
VYGHLPLLSLFVILDSQDEIETTQFLIQAGADTRLTNEKNETPLMIARELNHVAQVELLERVDHFRSTVKPMLITKAMEFEARRKTAVNDETNDQRVKPPAVI